MTISNTQIRVSYTGDGVSTSFPVPYLFYATTDLLVLFGGTPLASGYTVTGAGTGGGTVVFATPAPVGMIVQIILNVPLTQIVDLVDGTAFPSATLNQMVDRAIQGELRLNDLILRSIRAPDGPDTTPGMILPPSAARASQYLAFDSNGNAITVTALPGSNVTAAGIGALITPRTSQESTAGIVPVNLWYIEGDLRRYGGVGDGVADDSAAFQAAVSVGIVRLAQGHSYKIVTPATKTGTITILGEGKTSRLLCDGQVLTVTGGSSSILDNFYLENLTAPWIITRNPANWAATMTPVQSNGNGYQPTSNDFDIWGSLSPAQQNQNIGPAITFTGAASGIHLSRIYGRFVRLNLLDTTDSLVQDCAIRGGKGVFAAILFDNCTNNIQRGTNNRAINNKVSYASFCGITYISNDDFIYRGNHCYLCGESGTQTAQTAGFLFTGSVGGASSGTLTAPYTGPSFNDYQMLFENGEVRTVTLTNSSTAASWSPVLPSGNLLQVAAWGHSALFNNSTMAPMCFRGQIVGNHAYQNFYDGHDCDSTFGTTNGACRTYHQIADNYSWGNRGDAINIDGQFGNVTGNTGYSNGAFGIWGVCQNTQITANTLIDNNQTRNAALAEILAVGGPGNKIAHNYIWGGVTQNCPGIVVTQGSVNYIYGNIGVGTTVNNLGNIGLVASVTDGNIDSSTGARTIQSFCFELQNNAGTLQHIFYSDASGTGPGLNSRILGASSGGFTNTPAGTDSSTAFAAGAKIGSASTNVVWLNTAAQVSANAEMLVGKCSTSVGIEVNCSAQLVSLNINGVTQIRLCFQFTKGTDGSAFALTTTNITAGQGLRVQFYGKLA